MNPIHQARKLLEYINLESDLENHDRIHDEILQGIIFKGTNLWILVFAIVVASVGLNMNSTAVIIGAMLISPLMGPINGMGYSIATYNFELFRRAVKHYTFAVIASLITSTTYFSLSPISAAHSELLARTSPTIYDVIIAFFGGLAGILAISSRFKGNIIPGVAIATALMPPLCTAGYGLASRQYDFFLGAIYLFTINTVFIGIASLAMSQWLKFPIRTLVEATQRKRVNNIIWLVILIVLLPSIYFGYTMVEKERFTENANRYIREVSLFEGNYLLNHRVNPNKKDIHLIYGGVNLTESQKEIIRQKSKEYELQEATVLIEQGLSIKSDDSPNREVQRLREQLNTMSTLVRTRESQLDSLLRRHETGRMLLEEIRSVFPQIRECSYAPSMMYGDTTRQPITLIVFTLGKPGMNAKEKEKVNAWVEARLHTKDIQVLYSNP